MIELAAFPPNLQYRSSWRSFSTDTDLSDAVRIYVARQRAEPQYAIHQPSCLLLGPVDQMDAAPTQLRLL